MSLIEFVPIGHESSPIISVAQNLDEHSEGDEQPYHIFIDRVDRGVFDWEMSGDGKHGYIEYAEADVDIREMHIKKLAWAVITNCMHSIYPELETIDYTCGQEVFKNAS